MSDRNEVAKVKACKDCGAEFELTVGMLDWYKRKFGESYAEPSRCKNCRDRRREVKEQEQQTG
jgi:hypothetical protein